MRKLLFVAIITATLMVGCSDATAQNAADTEELDRRFEAVFAAAQNDPDLGSGLNTLASKFPADFARFRQEAHDQFVSAGNGAQTTYVARTIVGQVVAREMPNIARAPDDFLIDYARAMRDAYRVFGEHDPALCNQIASGVISDADKMTLASVRALSLTLDALLQAAAASRERPVERHLGAPSPEEFDLYLEALMKTDITAADAALIDDPQSIAQADPVTSCRVRRIMMDGVINLPPAVASRFVAGILNQNVAGRAR